MTKDNDKEGKGFSGLADLASEIVSINESKTSKPEKEVNPSSSAQEKSSTKSDNVSNSAHMAKTADSSIGKWIFGIIGIIFLILIISIGVQSNKESSYNSPSTSQSGNYPQSDIHQKTTSNNYTQNNPSSLSQKHKDSQSNFDLSRIDLNSLNKPINTLEYAMPPVGTNNVLSVKEIRWCLREKIRLKAMRNSITDNEGVREFNKIVSNYNSRCGSFRYRQGSRQQAERDVDAYKSQVEASARQEAINLGRSKQDGHSSLYRNSSASRKNNISKKQITREAQQLLTKLGYKPGPADGQYGRKTAEAVKAFQGRAGVTQNGIIDQNLLALLRIGSTLRSNLVNPSTPTTPKQVSNNSITNPSRSIANHNVSNDEFRQSLELACITAKTEGPAAYRRCENEQINAFLDSPGIPSLSGYDYETRQSLELACITSKSEGPAAYVRCLNGQINTLRSSPGIPNLSSYDYVTRQSLELACITSKSEGPAAYGRCLNGQINTLRSSPGIPNLSGYAYETRPSLELACITSKSEGPAAYGRCLRSQLYSIGAK